MTEVDRLMHELEIARELIASLRAANDDMAFTIIKLENGVREAVALLPQAEAFSWARSVSTRDWQAAPPPAELPAQAQSIATCGFPHKGSRWGDTFV